MLQDKGINAQIQEWQDLQLIDQSFSLDTLLTEQKYRFLPFDTQHFSLETKYKLLNSFGDLESVLNNEFIKADNFRALNTLKDKYKTSNTEGRRLAYLGAVLEDGDMAELKDALAVIAKSKGIDLPPFEGDTPKFARV
ncbi:hypothetical protein NHP190012_11840 [Helicobacter sp. NHP19-012]|uniref:Uncharacterized protein n=1 Tax=Helicobacter gastrofelis TaxID=2849642 RepID=A0ABM7SPI2_9HELI|nr:MULTISPECIES: hypothetical protein [unclassified Helicobacter]BCZ19542.1 hypothetical protein NHP190012_11840 [Helicobacter sp. NHP19-012]GMB96708.1 hypothetical protein NHP22001_12970 [Helicobacter sp. NHP22-001]